MKRVSFCEETQVYDPIMDRREMTSTLRLSQTLRQAAYSDTKKQQRKERLQSANAAWQDMDTDTEFVVK